MAITPEQRKRFKKSVDDLLEKAQRLDKTTVSGSLKLLDQYRKDVKSAILNAQGFDARFLPSILAEIDAQTVSFTNRLTSFIDGEQRESWAFGLKTTDKPLIDIGIQTSIPLISDELLAVTQGFTADLISGMSNDTKIRITTQLNNAILGKETPFETAKKIDKEIFKTKVAGGAPWKAEQIVRTEVNRVYSIASQARMEQAAKSVPGLGKQWFTAQNERVRGSAGDRAKHGIRRTPAGVIVDHTAAHGQIVLVNEPFIVSGENLMFPRDPSASAVNVISCVCTHLPSIASVA